MSSSKRLTQGSGDGVSTETWELQGCKYGMTVGVESQSAVECKAITRRLRADSILRYRLNPQQHAVGIRVATRASLGQHIKTFVGSLPYVAEPNLQFPQ